jgi:hypothetical protein
MNEPNPTSGNDESKPNGAERSSGPEEDAFNPFDPARLRINQPLGEGPAVRKLITSCPVRKPRKQEFIRVHPDPKMSMSAALLELQEDRQHYLVDPAIAPLLGGDVVLKILHLTVTHYRSLLVWPIKLPDEQGRLDSWNEVAHAAAEQAKESWVRLVPNMGASTYDVHEALGAFPDPEWPDWTLSQFLELAFKGRLIDDFDHPVLRRLRGEC